jgi:hypothetical protein
MSASYSIVIPQTLAPNQPAVFDNSPCPCREGLIFKKNTGVFLLASNAPQSNCNCGCRRIYETNYEVEVHANVEIPTGGTVEEIQLALAIDGIIDPSSVMSYTPTAVEIAGNVGTSIIVPVISLCGCDSVALVNASTQDITINNGSIVFDYAGVNRLR